MGRLKVGNNNETATVFVPGECSRSGNKSYQAACAASSTVTATIFSTSSSCNGSSVSFNISDGWVDTDENETWAVQCGEMDCSANVTTISIVWDVSACTGGEPVDTDSWQVLNTITNECISMAADYSFIDSCDSDGAFNRTVYASAHCNGTMNWEASWMFPASWQDDCMASSPYYRTDVCDGMAVTYSAARPQNAVFAVAVALATIVSVF